MKLCRKLQISMNLPVVAIKTNHGRGFDQGKFIRYNEKNGISNNLSAPRRSQQNGVVKRKSRTLEDMARKMICENDLPKSL